MSSEIPEGFPITLPAAALAGLDGLDPDDLDGGPFPGEGKEKARPAQLPLTLSPASTKRLRAEIERAGGREVCFLADVDDKRVVHTPRAVSRGNFMTR